MEITGVVAGKCTLQLHASVAGVQTSRRIALDVPAEGISALDLHATGARLHVTFAEAAPGSATLAIVSRHVPHGTPFPVDAALATYAREGSTAAELTGLQPGPNTLLVRFASTTASPSADHGTFCVVPFDFQYCSTSGVSSA